MRPARGFTLVELLVALFVFALLAAASTALLRFAVDSRARVDQRLDEAGALLRVRSLLMADMTQAAPRPWRDARGARRPAFTAGVDPLLVVVRRGWRNDDGAPRASLQRVEWRLRDGRLERLGAPMLDGAAAGTPAVLLTGVERAEVRVFARGAWAGGWADADPAALPAAVELTLTARGIGTVRQVFVLGPGA